ncbi:S-layer protein / N-acetylmuramoyl-L-alanine amidase [Bacillus thuringiensis serovar tolworthi]|uniref:S-layer protein / N-acetylmuramoyl-L-alanine amidase n=1 Tax=Bacillus thuringiensis subsp. tolworthi TaxID=1442 RepID=A0A9W3ZU92_BACTO|nr:MULTISPECIES: N-acetylmuramoyl-L-alanine amidase [Bacillus cereus group]MEB8711207.1 N-acetylmuramoyl-L-alanine amidase [Bacillus cereus]MRB03020.1 N-acetylmuramoyl-L-alanine amidase [Bacillus thuringiensis]MEB9435804.1 N-acetylmuramoyl-L-alanine amidase [Bacillus cereus]MEB9479632.1 N-acetylmuramoyl-L-alanine amidase [Bacillus cereus]MEB9595023.1 N-acetylmuramoyl-L-alanine amidase [Bacillus cereus]
MKYKLIATGILAGSLLSYSSNTFANTHKFPDVPAWADKSVNYLVDKQVLNGYPDGTFGSNDSLDRASATKIMTKVLGLQIDSNAKPSFTDSQNHWATPYIAAEKAGIVKGEGNGIFNPSGKVTRAAMATMLVNAYKLQSTPNHNEQVKFEDLKGHWGEKYANILIGLKISNGTENGWQPNRFITRAEAAQLTAKTDMMQHRQKNPLESKTIIIDPGHGGEDPGKSTKGLPESKIVLDTSLRLQQLLEKHTPFTVLLTRQSDNRPGHDQKSSLQERVKFAKKNRGDIFISVHANAFNGNAKGTETYYYKSSKSEKTNPHVEESRVLAEKIQTRLVEALQTRDRGVKHGDLHVIRENDMPAVLTELAFIDNGIDYSKLSTENGRQIAAEAIYEGILDYYEWKGNNVSEYRL